jgi:hypothetical protein
MVVSLEGVDPPGCDCGNIFSIRNPSGIDYYLSDSLFPIFAVCHEVKSSEVFIDDFRLKHSHTGNIEAKWTTEG